MSLVFENALTVRYQIQEMARVEKLTTDEQILDELRVYNPYPGSRGAVGDAVLGADRRHGAS